MLWHCMLCCVSYANHNLRGENPRYLDNTMDSSGPSRSLANFTALFGRGTVSPRNHRVTCELLTFIFSASSVWFIPAFSIAFRNEVDLIIGRFYIRHLRGMQEKNSENLANCFGARSERHAVVRYYRTRKGLRFYAVNDDPKQTAVLAITSLKQSSVGQIVRMHLTRETIMDELQSVPYRKVPEQWRQAFRNYLWRQRSRLS